ncbi:MAG TPA: hypothetical protein VIM55_01315 [Mucilaginibacter sp.]
MKSLTEDPKTRAQLDAALDDPTEPFANCRNEYAHEINRGDPLMKTYKGEGRDEPEGPNWDVDSDDAEGDTGQNAGVFK